MALVRQSRDGGSGGAGGDLLEGHDVLEGPQSALATKYTLEFPESVPVQQPDYRAHACRVGKDPDAVVAVK